jgi:spermidine synthase
VIPLAAVGLLSIVAQVVLLREIVSAFFGVELLYILALAAWMLGTAGGAAVARRWRVPVPGVAGAFAAAGLLLGLDVLFLRQAHTIAGGVPGAYLPFAHQLAVLLAAVIPVAAVLGALFPWVASSQLARGTSLAGAYGVESAGAVAGGLAVTALVKAGTSTLALAVWGVAAAAAVALGVLAGRERGAPATGRPRLRMAWMAAVALGGAAAVAVDHGSHLDLRLTARARPGVVAAVDTPYGRTTIAAAGGQHAVYENGALAFDTEGTSAEVFAALGAAQHEAPRDALVFGGVLEGVARELQARVSGRVTVYELDRTAYERARIAIASAASPAGPSPIFGDPRRLPLRDASVDLILNAMPEPSSGQASRFYTREFFRRCRAALRPGGVLAIRLPSSENFWPPVLRQRNTSVARTLGSEFPYVSAVPSATLYFFASDRPLPGGATVAARIGTSPAGARLATPAYAAYLYDSDRRADAEAVLASTQAPTNTDARPVCYRQTLMVWLAKFYPSLAASGGVDGPSAAPPAWAWLAATVLVVVTIWWGRRSRTRAATLLVLLAGVSGMLYESVLLLHVQITRGVVFEEVGALIACFMAGIAAGAALAAGLTARPAAGSGGIGGARTLAIAAAVLGIVLSFGLTAAVRLGAGPVVVVPALVVGGALVGAWFGAGSRLRPGDAAGAASSLYAADVAGGALAAVAATIFLIPSVGLDGTAMAAAACSAIALVLLL